MTILIKAAHVELMGTVCTAKKLEFSAVTSSETFMSKYVCQTI